MIEYLRDISTEFFGGLAAALRCPGGQIVEFDNFELYTPR